MKYFKKVMAFAVAMVMVVAMAMPAMAAAPTSGSITVKKNYAGQTYTLYKLFDAEITFNEDGTQRAITYKLPTGKSLASPATDWYEVNTNGFVEAKAALTDAVMKSAEYRAWAKEFGTKAPTEATASITAASDNDTNVKWTGLTWGYYFVDSTLGAFITVDTDNPDVEVNDKNNPPSIDKEITNAENGTVGDDTTQTAGDKGKNEAAIAQVGDEIGYKLTITAKPGAENYVVTDTLSKGLTPPQESAVTVACETPEITSSDYTVTVTTDDSTGKSVIKVEFTQAWLNKITEDATITITYTAVLNGDAVVGAEGNPNDVKLTWGHSTDEDVNYSEDEAKVYTAQVSVEKQDDSYNPLAGAGFVVAKTIPASGETPASTVYYKLDNGEVTWVTDIDQATEHFSKADGTVDPFTGLANGTYTLVEKTVPDGFNKLADTEFTIAGDDYKDTNLKQTYTVTNEAGAELPSTGGIGTTIFYLMGAVLMIGAGVLLVTRRRMSAD